MLRALSSGRDFKFSLEWGEAEWRSAQVFAKSAQARNVIDLASPPPGVEEAFDTDEDPMHFGTMPCGITKNLLLVPRASFFAECVLLGDPTTEVAAAAAKWLRAWGSSDLPVTLFGSEGENGIKVPLVERDVVSVINYTSRFYIVGLNCEDNWCCSCPKFCRTASCKHALGAAIRSGTTPVPPEFSLATIGLNKRGPGRPRTKRLIDFEDD